MLKSDPQMINTIYKILTAKDGEQPKDNNNDNAIKYLESNKDDILDLAENHYENLAEALTNNTIAIASYNPKPALPPSSFIFLNHSTQSDIYRIEDLELS